MRIGKLFMCFCLCLTLCSCGLKKASPNEVLGELLAGLALPAGAVYTSDTDSNFKLTEDLLERLFGEHGEKMRGVESAAVYLSAREEVCEAAVFYCYAASETREVAELFGARSALLAGYESSVPSKIMVKGRYVLFAAGERAEQVLAALARAVK